MNINELNRIETVNIDKAMEGVEYGTGTFKEILDKVYDNIIIPLVNNDGTIVGISYNSKATSLVDDNIAKMKFERAYYGKDIMGWTLKALELKAKGAVVSSVTEDGDLINVILNNGEVVIIGDECRHCAGNNSDCLPEEVEIPIDDVYDAYDEKEVLRYLRTEYNHYLSGNDEAPDLKVDEDSGLIYVTNIHWGRKM